MVEQSQRSMRKDYAVLIGSLNALFVHDASTGRREVPHATLPCAMNVIREGEECIARASDAVKFDRPLLFLRVGERLYGSLEQALPMLLLTALENFAGDIQVDSVRLLSALDPFLERQGKDTGVMAEPPEVSFAARETCTVDARLLTCADTNDRAMERIRNTVGLGIFEGQSGYNQVSDGTGGNLW
jgi:hypothetical protein